MTTDNKQEIVEIFISSMNLNDIKTVQDLIIAKAKEGFFYEHQTAGNLKNLANAIIDISVNKRESDEN